MSEYRSVVKNLPGVLDRQFTMRITGFYTAITGDSRYRAGKTLLNNETLDTDVTVKSDAVRAQLGEESDDE